MHFAEAAPVLRALAVTEAAGEMFDVVDAAAELGISSDVMLNRVSEIRARGLAELGLIERRPPMLLNAGRQFLALRGEVDDAVLRFLPRVIDDLHARRALIHGGVVLVDEFRAAVLDGAAIEHAQELVPPAFSPAVDERLAINLFAATVALMARLSSGRPAGCVGEEIVAVALLGHARMWLEMEVGTAALDAASFEPAVTELQALFDLFEDDDVLELFDMVEPSDAAVARDLPRNLELGVVDQTVEHWFQPFGWTTPTGYLPAHET